MERDSLYEIIEYNGKNYPIGYLCNQMSDGEAILYLKMCQMDFEHIKTMEIQRIFKAVVGYIATYVGGDESKRVNHKSNVYDTTKGEIIPAKVWEAANNGGDWMIQPVESPDQTTPYANIDTQNVEQKRGKSEQEKAYVAFQQALKHENLYLNTDKSDRKLYELGITKEESRVAGSAYGLFVYASLIKDKGLQEKVKAMAKKGIDGENVPILIAFDSKDADYADAYIPLKNGVDPEEFLKGLIKFRNLADITSFVSGKISDDRADIFDREVIDYISHPEQTQEGVDDRVFGVLMNSIDLSSMVKKGVLSSSEINDAFGANIISPNGDMVENIRSYISFDVMNSESQRSRIKDMISKFAVNPRASIQGIATVVSKIKGTKNTGSAKHSLLGEIKGIQSFLDDSKREGKPFPIDNVESAILQVHRNPQLAQDLKNVLSEYTKTKTFVRGKQRTANHTLSYVSLFDEDGAHYDSAQRRSAIYDLGMDHIKRTQRTFAALMSYAQSPDKFSTQNTRISIGNAMKAISILKAFNYSDFYDVDSIDVLTHAKVLPIVNKQDINGDSSLHMICKDDKGKMHNVPIKEDMTQKEIDMVKSTINRAMRDISDGSSTKGIPSEAYFASYLSNAFSEFPIQISAESEVDHRALTHQVAEKHLIPVAKTLDQLKEHVTRHPSSSAYKLLPQRKSLFEHDLKKGIDDLVKGVPQKMQWALGQYLSSTVTAPKQTQLFSFGSLLEPAFIAPAMMSMLTQYGIQEDEINGESSEFGQVYLQGDDGFIVRGISAKIGNRTFYVTKDNRFNGQIDFVGFMIDHEKNLDIHTFEAKTSVAGKLYYAHADNAALVTNNIKKILPAVVHQSKVDRLGGIDGGGSLYDLADHRVKIYPTRNMNAVAGNNAPSAKSEFISYAIRSDDSKSEFKDSGEVLQGFAIP